MGEKRVTDKRFGVKNDIIEDLRRFQLLVSLKYQRKRMAFVGYVNVTVNRAPTRVRVEAKEKRISITPSAFREGFHLPRQNLEDLDDKTVRLQISDGVQIELGFDQGGLIHLVTKSTLKHRCVVRKTKWKF
jgi:hypothetical protein